MAYNARIDGDVVHWGGPTSGLQENDIPMTRHDPIYMLHDKKYAAKDIPDSYLRDVLRTFTCRLDPTIGLEEWRLFNRAAAFVVEQEIKLREENNAPL